MTDVAGVESLCRKVAEKKATWRAVPLAQKLSYLKGIHQRLAQHRRRWQQLSNEVRGTTGVFANGSNGQSILLAGMWINGLIALYTELVATGKPPAPAKVHRFKDVTVAKVWPITFSEKLFTAASSAYGELYCNVKEGEPLQHALPVEGEPQLVGILGPGNIEGALEPLEILFLKGSVCVYKSNPVNALLTDELYPIIFEELLRDDYIGFIAGGAETGAALTASPLVDSLYMVGSAATYDRIVWGPGPEQAERKAAGNKACAKPFLAELGAVTPYVVVPGAWSNKVAFSFRACHGFD